MINNQKKTLAAKFVSQTPSLCIEAVNNNISEKIDLPLGNLKIEKILPRIAQELILNVNELKFVDQTAIEKAISCRLIAKDNVFYIQFYIDYLSMDLTKKLLNSMINIRFGENVNEKDKNNLIAFLTPIFQHYGLIIKTNHQSYDVSIDKLFSPICEFEANLFLDNEVNVNLFRIDTSFQSFNFVLDKVKLVLNGSNKSLNSLIGKLAKNKKILSKIHNSSIAATDFTRVLELNNSKVEQLKFYLNKYIKNLDNTNESLWTIYKSQVGKEAVEWQESQIFVNSLLLRQAAWLLDNKENYTMQVYSKTLTDNATMFTIIYQTKNTKSTIVYQFYICNFGLENFVFQIKNNSGEYQPAFGVGVKPYLHNFIKRNIASAVDISILNKYNDINNKVTNTSISQFKEQKRFHINGLTTATLDNIFGQLSNDSSNKSFKLDEESFTYKNKYDKNIYDLINKMNHKLNHELFIKINDEFSKIVNRHNRNELRLDSKNDYSHLLNESREVYILGSKTNNARNITNDEEKIRLATINFTHLFSSNEWRSFLKKNQDLKLNVYLFNNVDMPQLNDLDNLSKMFFLKRTDDLHIINIDTHFHLDISKFSEYANFLNKNKLFSEILKIHVPILVMEYKGQKQYVAFDNINDWTSIDNKFNIPKIWALNEMLKVNI